mgnify:CR=1 FL=1
MLMEVLAKPGSSRSGIAKEKGKLVAYLKSRPENNAANIELLKLMKKSYPGREIRIVRGRTAKLKLILIQEP